MLFEKDKLLSKQKDVASNFKKHKSNKEKIQN